MAADATVSRSTARKPKHPSCNSVNQLELRKSSWRTSEVKPENIFPVKYEPDQSPGRSRCSAAVPPQCAVTGSDDDNETQMENNTEINT